MKDRKPAQRADELDPEIGRQIPEWRPAFRFPPWAVASRNPEGLDAAGGSDFRQLVFVQVLVFIGLLGAGFAYAWRKGVFRWR